MPQRVVILSPNDFNLSQEAQAFRTSPAPMMGMIEDIYSISAPRKAWFVVYTNPNREDAVAKNLADMNVDAFLPHITEWRPRTRAERDQKKPLQAITRPLLPRYLFANLPAAERAYGIIQAVDGVKEVLGNGERKIPVATPLVEFIREQEASGVFNKTIKRGRIVAPKWAVEGAVVRITTGPFADFMGVIERCLKKDQVEIALSMFGRHTSTKLGLTDVELAR